MSTDTVPLPPAFFELNGEHISASTHGGQRSWHVRGEHFVAVLTWAAAGQAVHEAASPDAHLVLVLDGGAAEVAHEEGQVVAVAGPAIVVVPAGDTEVRTKTAGYLVQIFTARGDVVAKAVNASTYGHQDPATITVLDGGRGDADLQVVPLSTVPEEVDGSGRTFRTPALTITWSTAAVPDDGGRLLPHVHHDTEHASITLTGDHVHHVRRPWTDHLADWRPDEHVQVTSPSVSIVPPGNIHATRRAGAGPHQSITVLAAARADLCDRAPLLTEDSRTAPNGVLR